MSATLSEATGRPYGIQRVCQAWERSRSALYARQTREQQRHKGEEPARRGPTPTVSDATLLEAIQADLDRSPFQGEGHRKVHARLRILDGIRVARTRVLRVMRAHKLLSPHRGRQGWPAGRTRWTSSCAWNSSRPMSATSHTASRVRFAASNGSERRSKRLAGVCRFMPTAGDGFSRTRRSMGCGGCTRCRRGRPG